MSWIVAFFFYSLAVVCLIAAVVFIVVIVQWCMNPLRPHIGFLIILIILFFFSGLLMLLCFFSTQEVNKEKDKHYLASLFRILSVLLP